MIHDMTGLFWMNYDERRISGWVLNRYKYELGDSIIAEMESGKKAIFEILKRDFPSDPDDQLFLTVSEGNYYI